MRRRIVAGNWKMNTTFQEAEELLDEVTERLKDEKEQGDVDVIICPPSLYMEMALDLRSDEEDENDIYYSVGGQDVSEFECGAYTGDISAEMLASMGVEYCIVGHSERRKYHGETNRQIARKVENLLKNDISPIVCCGETLEERESGKCFEVIEKQVRECLFDLQSLDFTRIIIAYEPVWAIGTGKTASPEQAQEVHAFIRNLVQEKYGKEIARVLPILYGGSCNPSNAAKLFEQADIDGGLIGGASLSAEDFIDVINSFE